MTTATAKGVERPNTCNEKATQNSLLGCTLPRQRSHWKPTRFLPNLYACQFAVTYITWILYYKWWKVHWYSTKVREERHLYVGVCKKLPFCKCVEGLHWSGWIFVACDWSRFLKGPSGLGRIFSSDQPIGPTVEVSWMLTTHLSYRIKIRTNRINVSVLRAIGKIFVVIVSKKLSNKYMKLVMVFYGALSDSFIFSWIGFTHLCFCSLCRLLTCLARASRSRL